MPTYTFKNKLTGAIEDKFMGISESEEFLHTHPHYEKMPTLFSSGGVQDVKHKRVDDGWKETLSKIKETSKVVGRNNNINHWL